MLVVISPWNKNTLQEKRRGWEEGVGEKNHELSHRINGFEIPIRYPNESSKGQMVLHIWALEWNV